MSRRYTCLAIALAAFGLAIPGVAFGADSTRAFSARSDTYVSASARHKQHAGSATLRVGSRPLTRGYLRFDVRGLEGL